MRKELTEILHSEFAVPLEAIASAKMIKKEKGGNLANILLHEEFVSEPNLLKALSKQYNIPFIEKIEFDNIDTSFTSFVSINYLRRFYIVPVLFLKNNEGEVDFEKSFIAINNPIVFQEFDDLISVLSKNGFVFPKEKIALSTKEDINSTINFIYDRSRDSAQNLVNNLEDAKTDDILNELDETADLLDDSNDAPIIKLVNHMIAQSIKARASDIHIEPYQDAFKVRYRIDGILYDLLTPPKWIQAPLVSRIKIMAKLDIAEKRLPQDGRIEVKIGNQNVDLRVSTIPISFGERVVLRILDKSSSVLELDKFGLMPQRLEQVKRLIQAPNGIILVTGPTGSGKTTTLYGILKEIHKPEINIITIEDPVEYKIDGIGQIQVNPKIDLTFARGLRSIVRQDPDVILVGEIRDKETAEIAVQSALTGHLVLSTLHTNDAPSAITRLVDIGIEPFLISSAVNAVLAQRLVRTLCDACKKEYKPSEEILKSIGLDKSYLQSHKFFKSVGCTKCFNTGYRGRQAIFEIMELNEGLKDLILKNTDASKIKQYAIQNCGLKTLRYDGVVKVLQGHTTIQEVLRVTNL